MIAVIDVVLNIILMDGGHIVIVLRLLLHALVVHWDHVALPEERDIVQGGLALTPGVGHSQNTLLKLVGSGQQGLRITYVLGLRLMENHLVDILLDWLVLEVVLLNSVLVLQLLSQHLLLLLYLNIVVVEAHFIDLIMALQSSSHILVLL